MTATFCLADDPWIPVRMLNGVERTMGLEELFLAAHEIEDLALPVPPAASGLWRILYAITARIIGLDARADPDYLEDGGRVQWVADRSAAFGANGFEPGGVAEFFGKHRDRFFLFGPGVVPFLQDPRLVVECAKSSGLNKLVFSRPSGNNHAWWSHTTDSMPSPLRPAEAAWWLIAQLYFGASGRCTSRTVDGVSSASTKAGPLRGAISFHPLGRNMFESLVTGLPQPMDTGADTEDQYPWEAGLAQAGDPAHPVTWPGQLLAGRARHAALLVASPDGEHVLDAYLTWAVGPAAEAVDPYLVRNRAKEGHFYTRPADCHRALWRDLDALLQEGTDDSVSPPPVLSAFNGLPPDIQRSLRVRAYGFDQDGQAADKQYFTAVTPSIFKYATREQVQWMRECRVAAEKVGRQLAYAAKIARSESAGPGGGRADGRGNGTWAARSQARYWPQAERGFWDLLDDPRNRDPLAVFVALAITALEDVVGQAASTQPGAKALYHATSLLRRLLAPGQGRDQQGG